LTLILDLPAEAGLKRAGARRQTKGEGVDRFEEEDTSFHSKLRETFLAIAKAEPGRCVVIAADRSPDEVEEAIWEAVQARLPKLAGNKARPAYGA
jgi:dTMP kinase